MQLSLAWYCSSYYIFVVNGRLCKRYFYLSFTFSLIISWFSWRVTCSLIYLLLTVCLVLYHTLSPNRNHCRVLGQNITRWCPSPQMVTIRSAPKQSTCFGKPIFGSFKYCFDMKKQFWHERTFGSLSYKLYLLVLLTFLIRVLESCCHSMWLLAVVLFPVKKRLI